MHPKKSPTKNLHIGQFIKHYIDTHRINVTELADKIHYSRRNLYQIFEKASVDTSLLDKLHKALGDEFIKQYLKEKYLPQIQSIFSERRHISPSDVFSHLDQGMEEFLHTLRTNEQSNENKKFTYLSIPLQKIAADLELLKTQQKTTLHLLNLLIEKLSG